MEGTSRETQLLVDSIEQSKGNLEYWCDFSDRLREAGEPQKEVIEVLAECLKDRYSGKLSRLKDNLWFDSFFKAILSDALENVDFMEAARQLTELAGG